MTAILPPSDPDFFPENKSTWFNESTYVDYLGVNPSHSYLYPSEVAQTINDRILTLSFKAAIELNADLFQDKTVLVLDSGIGLFSLLAAQNGAAKVLSVCNNATLAKYATKIASENGFANVIDTVSIDIKDIVLPYKVDIIICNWMGDFLLHSSLIQDLIYARDNFLDKKNGLILPDKATMFLAGIEDVEYKKEKLGMWKDVYGIDMNCVEKESLCSPLVDIVNSKAILTTISPIYSIDAYTVQLSDLNFSNEYELVFLRKDTMCGFVSWFDVKFSSLPNHVKFTTGPYNESTKFRQVIFYTEDNEKVNKGDIVKGSICGRINTMLEDMKGIDVKISYKYSKKNDVTRNGDKSGVQMYKIL